MRLSKLGFLFVIAAMAIGGCTPGPAAFKVSVTDVQLGHVATFHLTPQDGLELRFPPEGEVVLGRVDDLAVGPKEAVVRFFLNDAGDDPSPWWFAMFDCRDGEGRTLVDRHVQLMIESPAMDHCARDLRIEVRFESPGRRTPAVVPQRIDTLGNG